MKPDREIEIVRAWMAPQLEQGTSCPCCDRFTKIYKRKFNSGMACFLIDFYKKYGTSAVNMSDHHPVDQQRAHHQEYEKLPHWGLLTRTDSSPHLWSVTPLGVLFLRGETGISKWVWLKHGVCVQKSKDKINIRQALGSKFDYKELMAPA